MSLLTWLKNIVGWQTGFDRGQAIAQVGVQNVGQNPQFGDWHFAHSNLAGHAADAAVMAMMNSWALGSYLVYQGISDRVAIWRSVYRLIDGPKVRVPCL